MQSQICAYYAQVSLNLIVSSFLSVYIFFHPQPGMRQKLEQIAQQLDWIERMDVTVAREKEDKDGSLKTAAMSTLTSEKSIHDDFQREMRL